MGALIYVNSKFAETAQEIEIRASWQSERGKVPLNQPVGRRSSSPWAGGHDTARRLHLIQSTE